MLGNLYLGAEDEKFNVTAYYIQQAELDIYGTFTPKHCFPATEGYVGEVDASEFFWAPLKLYLLSCYKVVKVVHRESTYEVNNILITIQYAKKNMIKNCSPVVLFLEGGGGGTGKEKLLYWWLT